MGGGDEMEPETVTFNHDKPVSDWILAPGIVAIATYMTYGGVFGQEPWAIGRVGALAVWLFGIGLAISSFFHPRVTLAVKPDGVVVLERWLWHSRESGYATADLSEPEIVGGKGEDDFRCVVRLPNGRKLTICSSGSRGRVEDVRDRLSAALRSGPVTPVTL